MTAMILQNTISRFNLFWIESFDSWVCYYGETWKKSVERRSKKQRSPFSELSFELTLTLWIQWFCKIPFQDLTSFELKVLIVQCATLESQKKKSVECQSKENGRAFSEFSFKLALPLWLQWFCKIPFPDSTSFELNVLIAECVNLESHKKEICWVMQQGTEISIFRVIFQIGFSIMTSTAMIRQTTITRFNLFWIESFDSWMCYFGEQRIKSEVHFQSYLLNWLWHYAYNDSAKYNFHIQLLSNWKFW